MAQSGAIVGFWAGLGTGARVGLVTGMVAIVLVAGGTFWLIQPDYRVLFTNLTDTDAAAIVAELKRTKALYRLADGGATVRVPSDRVYETRFALMSSGAPLSGGVGFEIFDKQGLGATEQSQRVSYQRALQGELARTIGSLEHVRQAHVLLVMPESSLFRRDRQEPRAAVSLLLQSGPALERDQVAGIQRLVAASVAGLDPARVVVTDQRGVTLSEPDGLTGTRGLGSGRLEMKREIEGYFTKKIVALLDSAFGPGQAIVSVDVALNFDEVRRTVQNLVPAPATSVDPGVKRKRLVVTGTPATDPVVNSTFESSPPRASSNSTDVEYEYGHTVEQVVAAPGSIEQMSVGVIVRGPLIPDKVARVTQLVRMAAGLNERRGDRVAVQPLESSEAGASASATESVAMAPSPSTVAVSGSPVFQVMPWFAAAIGVIGALLGALLLALFRRKQGSPRPLSTAERASLLEDLHKAFGTTAERAP